MNMVYMYRYIYKNNSLDLSLTKVDNQLLDGFHCTKNKADKTKKNNESTPSKLINWLVANTGKLEIKCNREDENQGTVTKSTN